MFRKPRTPRRTPGSRIFIRQIDCDQIKAAEDPKDRARRRILPLAPKAKMGEGLSNNFFHPLQADG
jgi:hypothetical protein